MPCARFRAGTCCYARAHAARGSPWGPVLVPTCLRDDALGDPAADRVPRPSRSPPSSSPFSALSPHPNLHAPSPLPRAAPRPPLNRYIIATYKLSESTTFDNAIASAIKKGSVSGAFELPKGLSGKVKLAKPAAAAGKEVSFRFALALPTLSSMVLSDLVRGPRRYHRDPVDASECVARAPVTRSRPLRSRDFPLSRRTPSPRRPSRR